MSAPEPEHDVPGADPESATGDAAVDRALAEAAPARETLERDDAGPEELAEAADRLTRAHRALQERLSGGTPG